ncbi:MAG TPA: glycosyltransferase family 4 protein [Solirubrobacterales bacterium]|nr:glycosyltransferase family 4 protein [Solirubrobacterales bacterium]
MRIDMFVYNRCTTDPRVLKEARTLSGAGHRVRIVAVLDATTAPREERDGFQIVRIDRDPIHYRLLRASRRAGSLWRRPAKAMVQGQASSDRPVDGAAPPVTLEGGLKLLWRAWVALSRPFKRATRRLLLVPHKPLMFFDYYRRAYRVVRANPPDALHAHDLNTLPVAAALAKRLRLPLTYDAHELYPEISTLSRREAAIWRWLERRLAPRADRTLTVCDSIARELELRYRIPPPTVVLNCPVSGNANAGPVKRPLNGGPKSREPVVLYQGGFAPNRGLRTLVLSAHGLERGTIVLMGWGRLEDELRELIETEGLGDRVQIVDPVPPGEVVAAAATASIGVIPYEPVGLNNTLCCPNKLFDYLAAGLPVVASRLPELSRIVEQGELGLTFTPGEPGALGVALNEILADRERYGRMRERAHEAAERYTWEQESKKLLALYDGKPT